MFKDFPGGPGTPGGPYNTKNTKLNGPYKNTFKIKENISYQEFSENGVMNRTELF